MLVMLTMAWFLNKHQLNAWCGCGYQQPTHRHLRKIDQLMVCTACLVCLVSTVSGCHKNAIGRGSATSQHITKLEQSTFL